MTDDLRTEVMLLKKDIGVVSKLVEKFDTTTEKLQQVAGDLSKIVAIQEQKMFVQDKINTEVDKILDRQQQDHNTEMKNLYKRIDEVEKKVDASQKAILAELASVKEDLNTKIKSLEAWRYMVMGIISFAVFVVSQGLGVLKFFGIGN